MNNMYLEELISVACLASNQGILKDGMLADLQQMYDDIDNEYKDAIAFHLIEIQYDKDSINGNEAMCLLDLLEIKTGASLMDYYSE